MKLIGRILAFAAIVVLTACVGIGDIEKLNNAEPVGSPYNKYLAAEYRDLANRMGGGYSFFYGSSDAAYFARKGLAAVDGVLVMPEAVQPGGWGGSEAGFADLARARSELVVQLENGGREMAPADAAAAQASFDCWVRRGDAACHRRFMSSLEALKAALGQSQGALPPPAPEEFPAPVTSEAGKGGAVPVQQAMFLVFFDWDKHDLTASARSVLDAVAQALSGRKDVQRVVVVGHTDTSGGEKYNNALSLKRANAVRSYLAARGFAADKIRVEGRGKKDLLVKTPDNVRQPENRRAQITLE